MRDTVPNKTNVMQATVERPGTYEGACTQFCGTQHAWMRSRVMAQTPSDFDSWVGQQRQPEVPPTESLAMQGRQLFLASTCVNCHTVQGTIASGQAAPDLTHLGSRTTIGGGVAANTPGNLRDWIRDPKTLKPGVLMPGYPLSDGDLAALVAYLEGLK
jgi:cytochrome c oxidase subunit 2